MSHVGEPFGPWLTARRAAVEEALTRALDDDGAPPALRTAMRYSVLAGGKRLRPLLVLGAAEACGAGRGLALDDAMAIAMPAACALELIHTYSLVHDDLPSMDNDTLRRGRPTSHVVHGEALAILAGDALLTEAFALLARQPLRATTPTDAALTSRMLRVVSVIATAAGADGMVGGQVLDLQATAPGATPLDRDALRAMHSRKTGALIQASVTAGAIIGGADEAGIGAVATYGEHIGLAFQIVDDILDVEGASSALGKTAGKDAAAGKLTYPAVYGLAESRRLADSCVARALGAIADAGLEGQLPAIAHWVVSRTH